MRRQNFLGDNDKSTLLLLSDTVYPRFRATYGGNDAFRDPLELDVDSFVGVKSYKAKGKRITTCTLDKIEELPPLRQPEPAAQPEEAESNTEAEAESNELPTLFD